MVGLVDILLSPIWLGRVDICKAICNRRGEVPSSIHQSGLGNPTSTKNRVSVHPFDYRLQSDVNRTYSLNQFPICDPVGRDSYLDAPMSILENRPTVGQLHLVLFCRGNPCGCPVFY